MTHTIILSIIYSTQDVDFCWGGRARERERKREVGGLVEMRGAFFSGGDGSSRIVGNIIRDDSRRAQGTNLNYLGGKKSEKLLEALDIF